MQHPFSMEFVCCYLLLSDLKLVLLVQSRKILCICYRFIICVALDMLYSFV